MMAAYFLDTSAIVKRYLQETGTAWVAGITAAAAGNELFLAGITQVEVVSAVCRRQRGGTISPHQQSTILTQFRQDLLQEYEILDITPALLTQAMQFAETYSLRAYDAVQLAAVNHLHLQRNAQNRSAVTLISADQELNAAAAALGIAVEDPHSRP